MGLLLLVVSCAPVAAQEVSLGLRGGINFSTVRFQDPNVNEQTELRTGLHGGVALALDLTPYLEAEASLLFSQGGYLRKAGQTWDVYLDYLELPVILRAKLPARVSPYLLAGLTPRVRVQCKLYDVAVVGETTCDDPVVGRDWKGVDLTAVGGMGVGLPAGPGRLLLEATLGWGLVDLNDDTLPPGWAKNADIRLSTVYRLPWR